MKNKVFIGLAIVIVIGIIVTIAFGLNVDYSYKNHNLVDVKIGKEFNVSDIKAITDEVFPKQNADIQVAGEYKDDVIIKVNSISDEQKANLNTKINEKFGLENKVEDITVSEIPSYRLRDILKSYAIPLGITTILILVYMCIRFRKLGVSKVLCQTLAFIVIAELLYGAIIAITRYPVNRLVIPSAVVIYIAIVTVLTGIFEKQIKTVEK